MKKTFKTLTFILVFVFFCYCFIACNQNPNNDWKKTDINGYYMRGFGSSASYYSYGLELHDEGINDATKTFVIRYNDDDYHNGIAIKEIFELSYGYYIIDKIYERDNYIEYHINLIYISKGSHAPDYDNITIDVRPERTICYYNGDTLYKKY